MSEHQYHEWQTLEYPLTVDEQIVIKGGAGYFGHPPGFAWENEMKEEYHAVLHSSHNSLGAA